MHHAIKWKYYKYNVHVLEMFPQNSFGIKHMFSCTALVSTQLQIDDIIILFYVLFCICVGLFV